MTNDGACFLPKGYTIMLWPLSWDDDTRWSMFHTLGMNKHAMSIVMSDDNWRSMFSTWGIYDLSLTDVMRRWQLTKHVSYLTIYRYALTVVRDDDNWRSMFHTWGIYHHALAVVMTQWQLTENDPYLRDIWPCSVLSNEVMTTDGACLIHVWYITILWQLSWDNDNWRSMINT